MYLANFPWRSGAVWVAFSGWLHRSLACDGSALASAPWWSSVGDGLARTSGGGRRWCPHAVLTRLVAALLVGGSLPCRDWWRERQLGARARKCRHRLSVWSLLDRLAFAGLATEIEEP